ncbi:MAG TPA: hypothetical protein VKS78_10830 [Roseiarcus sp.]|nr:hypothetical protein [Roseiarcus sp.]
MLRKREGSLSAGAPIATSLALALLAGALASGPACAGGTDPSPDAQPAGQNDSPFKSVLKLFNITTDVGQPQDFVRATRPADPKSEDYIPVYPRNLDHKTKVLTPDQLKAMQSEMDATSTQNGAIRDAFPPAQKAYADSEKQKAAAKKSPKQATPPAATATQ